LQQGGFAHHVGFRSTTQMIPSVERIACPRNPNGKLLNKYFNYLYQK
jgi:hypothetical protein